MVISSVFLVYNFKKRKTKRPKKQKKQAKTMDELCDSFAKSVSLFGDEDIRNQLESLVDNIDSVSLDTLNGIMNRYYYGFVKDIFSGDNTNLIICTI